MAFLSDKKCPYCAETIKGAAEICRFCNRTVLNAKLCTSCCEPLRQTAMRCRFCQMDQAPGASKESPAKEDHAMSAGAPFIPSYGFQMPVHNPVYDPIQPKKFPEQCQAEQEFQNWQKQRRDAIAHGDKLGDNDE